MKKLSYDEMMRRHDRNDFQAQHLQLLKHFLAPQIPMILLPVAASPGSSSQNDENVKSGAAIPLSSNHE